MAKEMTEAEIEKAKRMSGVYWGHPALIYSTFSLENAKRIGMSIKDFMETMEEQRRAIKYATGYTWDNGHFYLTENGKIVATFFVTDSRNKEKPNECVIHLWSERTRTSLGTLTGEQFTPEIIKELDTILRHLAKGEVKCFECGEWRKDGEWKHYSYAGSVCNNCYDPIRHRLPDTWGDG